MIAFNLGIPAWATATIVLTVLMLVTVVTVPVALVRNQAGLGNQTG